MAHEFANQRLLTPSVSFDHSINSSAFAPIVPRAYRETTGEGVYKKFGKQGREYFKLVPVESSTKRGFKGGKDDLDPSLLVVIPPGMIQDGDADQVDIGESGGTYLPSKKKGKAHCSQ